MKYKKIVLLGFRGVGKSAVSKILSERLKWKMIELDEYIVSKAGLSIAELTKNGKDWTRFRELESESLQEICHQDNCIISCGGGVGVNETNGKQQREILEGIKNSLQIVLSVPEDILVKRLTEEYSAKGVEHRPAFHTLTGSQDSQEFVDKLISQNVEVYRERKVLYEIIGDLTLIVDRKTPEEVAQVIIEVLNKGLPK